MKKYPPAVPMSPHQSIRIERMLPQDEQVVREAMELLRRFVCGDYDHAFNVLTAIRYDPTGCGPNALACTGGQHGRVAVLAHRPSMRGLVETAVSVRHEADHVRLHPCRCCYWIEPHLCGPCDTAQWQAIDPIYQRDNIARRAITDGLQEEAWTRAREEAWARHLAPFRWEVPALPAVPWSPRG